MSRHQCCRHLRLSSRPRSIPTSATRSIPYHRPPPKNSPKGLTKSPIEGDPERIVSLPHTKFDVAAVVFVLHHVDDITGFMTGLIGLLEEGGWVVFAEFTNLAKVRKVSFPT